MSKEEFAEADDSAVEMKECPFCGEQIRAVAMKCRYCGKYLDPGIRRASRGDRALERLVVPVGRPITAIAAGYLALFSVLPICGLPVGAAAVYCGLSALAAIKADPELAGKGRAYFGIVVGGLMCALNVVGMLILIGGHMVGQQR